MTGNYKLCGLKPKLHMQQSGGWIAMNEEIWVICEETYWVCGLFLIILKHSRMFVEDLQMFQNVQNIRSLKGVHSNASAIRT